MAGTPPAIDDGNPCTADTCDPALGVLHLPLVVGTSCSDGNICNGLETCDGVGTCVAGMPPVIDDGNPCTADSCDPAAGVTHAPVPEGTSCSDGNPCNGEETCNASADCVPSAAPEMDDGNPCTADSCDPVAGVTHTPLPVGSSCSDGDVCNGQETCDGAGTCRPGVPLVVDDGDPCTVDGCDPVTGAVHAPDSTGAGCCAAYCEKAVAAACTNGPHDQASCEADCQGQTDGRHGWIYCTPQWGALVACTVDDGPMSCDAYHMPVASGCAAESADWEYCAAACSDVVNDGDPCTVDHCECAPGGCDADTLIVTHPAAPAGTPCPDGQACNGDETCDGSGTCVAGTPAPAGTSCSDGKICNGNETCNGAGTCAASSPAPAGTPCPDGNLCNGNETCNGTGTCTAGTPLVVDDGNPCTVDACNPTTGVITHTPKAAGTACPDGNLCNGNETCNASGTCVAGTPPVIDDGNPCTTDTCSPTLGVRHTRRATGSSCSDGNLCNGNETCNASGTCVAGTPPVVNDGNPCTVDSCDPVTGVHHTPVAAGTSCSDGNVCNGNETCNASGACIAGAPPVIDDGNPCTVDSCDPATGVHHTPKAVGTICGDASPCSDEPVCNDSGTCVAGAPAPAGSPCLDGNVCNGAETCNGAGVCLPGIPPVVDDGNPCTVDSCDPVAGVTHVPATAGTPCPNSTLCDGNELCDGAGMCLPGTPPVVDDGNPCTTDACDPVLGVTHTPTASVGTDCGSGMVCTNSGACVPLPADPALQAPPVDRSVPSTVATTTAFLYTGAGAAQGGVAAGTIIPERAAVVRGATQTREGEALGGVFVTVRDHPEFGQTLSRADGAFDLAVNGGGSLALQFRKGGHLPAERRLDVPWEDYAQLGVVALVPLDSNVTQVDFSAPITAARGSVATDTDGVRQATLLFPQGTTAEMVLPDSSVVPLPTLSVRLTEYTVGDHGPLAMPQLLPPSSQYTYAVELSADEAIAAGATKVRLSQPVALYVENFLDFPTGGAVPVGRYDREADCWAPQNNGRIVEILAVANGLAELDIDGTGLAADAAALAALGITDAERQELAALYSPGQTLWRVPVQSFSPWDCNWPGGPPPGAPPPGAAGAGPAGPPGGGGSDPNCSEEGGSAIECQNQALGQSAPLVSAPFSLHYQSDRVAGRRAANTMQFRLTGGSIPASLERIDYEVLVAGQKQAGTTVPAPDQHVTFVWDGKDAYGRNLQGSVPATIRIGYVYPAHYYAPADLEQAFGVYSAMPGVSVTPNRARQEVTIWQEWVHPIGAWDAAALGFGGWSVSEHHAYDPQVQVIYEGNGRRRTAGSIATVIARKAGGGTSPDYLDPSTRVGLPATELHVYSISAVASAPDGTFYFADHDVVWRVGHDGLLQHVAGCSHGFASWWTPSHCVAATDGVSATHALFAAISSIAVASNGSLYLADSANYRIYRVGVDGVVQTVAGTGSNGDPGSGGLALAVPIDPYHLGVAANGTLYFSLRNLPRVWRLGCDGLVLPVAGTGASGFSGDGGPALSAKLSTIGDLDVGSDGSLYVLDDSRVRRVTPDGIIRTIAGKDIYACCNPGDEGPATAAILNYPSGIALGSDDSVYIAESSGANVRVIRPDGIIHTFAGHGTWGIAGDGGPSRAAELRPRQLAVAPDGRLLMIDGDAYFSDRVRVIGWPFPRYDGAAFLVPSEDGEQVYEFSASGRHLRTVRTLTGVTLFEFGYDAEGRLATVADADGKVTSIDRDGAGKVAAIVGPYGQPTSFELDANGYLATLTNPGGETESFSYSPDGLMLSHTDANGHASSYEYDALGRLTRDTAPDGFSLTFSRTESGSDFTVLKTSAMGRATRYQVRSLPDGTEQRTNTFPNGLQAMVRYNPDGTTNATLPDGRSFITMPAPDPRFGMLAPITASASTTTPAGKTLATTRTRTVTLSDPNDPLSAASLTDTRAVNGKTTTRLFTGSSRTLRTTTPVGRQATSTLDTRGRVVQSSLDSLLATAFSYDAQGRLAGITRGTRSWARTYDALGWLQTASDPLSQVTSYERDAVGRVLELHRPDGATVGWAYDPKGHVIGLTPPGRPAHVFDYTASGERSEYAPPDAGFNPRDTTWTYNLDRAPDFESRPDGVTLDQQYDSAGRLIRITTPEGAVTRTYSPTTGLLASVTTPSGVTLSYTYDGNLLTLASWSGPFAASVGFDYDNDFRIVTERVKAANPLSFGYDNDSLVTQAGSLGLTYEPLTGFLSTTTLGIVQDARTYSTYGEPATYQANVSGSPVYSVSYVRDGLGRITDKTETVDGDTTAYHYTYDLAGRLVEVERDGVLASEYSYDDNGNRVGATIDGASVMGTYDAQDRLVGYGDYTYDFTANGELATRTNTTASQSTSYVYDAFGNLRQVTLPSGTVIDYLVDGQNRRVVKKVGGVPVKGFVYRDSLRPIAELDGAGNVVSRFVYGTGKNVPDYMVKGGTAYRLVTDHLGNVRLVVNATTGEIVQEMTYDEFGRVLQDSNAGFQPFGFAGGLYDPDTGLVRFGARDYAPEVGRWTAKDPIGFRGGDPNLYGYVLDDPINWTDPRGRIICGGEKCAHFGLGGLLGTTTTVPLPDGGSVAAAAAAAVAAAVVTAVIPWICEAVTGGGDGGDDDDCDWRDTACHLCCDINYPNYEDGGNCHIGCTIALEKCYQLGHGGIIGFECWPNLAG